MEKLGPVVKLYVGNVHSQATNDEVVSSLSDAAKADILHLVRRNTQQGFPPRYAFIMVRNQDVEKFIGLNGKFFFGKKLIIKVADNQTAKIKAEIPIVRTNPESLTVPQQTPAMTYEEIEKMSDEEGDTKFNR